MIDAFIVAGQSNAYGYGLKIQLDPVPEWAQTANQGWTGGPTTSSDSGTIYPAPTAQTAPGLWIEHGTGLSSDIPSAWASPQVLLTGTSNYGPEYSFALLHLAANPGRQIALVKQTLGGSSLHWDWMPANGGDPARLQWTVLQTMISQAQQRLDAGGEPWQWAGFLWMHGESGAQSTDATSTAYRDDLRIFLAAVRSLTRSDLPVVLGRIGDNLIRWPSLHYTLISNGKTEAQARALAEPCRIGAVWRRTLQSEVGSDASNRWWDNDGLPLRPNDTSFYHYSGAGLLAMGERAYRAYQTVSRPTARSATVTAGGIG